MIHFSLPWPPSALRPNAGARHWRAKHAAAQPYKLQCLLELSLQGVGVVDAERLHLTLRFCPPDRRRRDIDNLLAQMKHAIDAVSEAVGVDDYFFDITLCRGDVVKGGRVDIVIHE